MQLTKFEEKTVEFLKENDICNPMDDTDLFKVDISSLYQNKRLSFQTTSFMFTVVATNFEELFDKAFRVLKSYGSKSTRNRSEGSTEQGE